jgi:serine/threonine protein kinase
MHGSVDASSVIFTSAGAQLLPPNGLTRYTAPRADVSAFGALLYEMLTGSKPSTRSTQPIPPIAARNTEEGIQIAARRLASKCLQSTSNTFSEMQKVLTEVRLLSLQTRIRVKPACLPPVAAIPEPTRRTVCTVKPNPQTYVPLDGPVVHCIFTAVPADGFMASNDVDSVDASPSGIKCPVCGVAYVYPSRPRNWFETVLSAWGSPLLRCHRCLHRYVIVMRRFKFAKGSPLKANRKSQIR